MASKKAAKKATAKAAAKQAPAAATKTPVAKTAKGSVERVSRASAKATAAPEKASASPRGKSKGRERPVRPTRKHAKAAQAVIAPKGSARTRRAEAPAEVAKRVPAKAAKGGKNTAPTKRAASVIDESANGKSPSKRKANVATKPKTVVIPLPKRPPAKKKVKTSRSRDAEGTAATELRTDDTLEGAPVAPANEGITPAGVGVGDHAPSFVLQDDTKTVMSSESLRGSPYVLYFYPKDDTPGCTLQACGFRDSLPRFSAKGVRVIGVSPDLPEAHARFKKKYGLSFPLLSDPEKTLAKAYGVWVKKQNYGREYMGVERSTFFVDRSGTIKEVWRGVKVPGHVDKVLDAV